MWSKLKEVGCLGVGSCFRTGKLLILEDGIKYIMGYRTLIKL